MQARSCSPPPIALAYNGHSSPFEGLSTPNYPVWGLNAGDIYLSGTDRSSGYFYPGYEGWGFGEIWRPGSSGSGNDIEDVIFPNYTRGRVHSSSSVIAPDFSIISKDPTRTPEGHGLLDSFSNVFPMGNRRSVSSDYFHNKIYDEHEFYAKKMIPDPLDYYWAELVNSDGWMDKYLGDWLRAGGHYRSVLPYIDNSEKKTIPLKDFGCRPAWADKTVGDMGLVLPGVDETVPLSRFAAHVFGDGSNTAFEVISRLLHRHPELRTESRDADCLWMVEDGAEKDTRLKTLALAQDLTNKLISGDMSVDDVREVLRKNGFDRDGELDALTRQAIASKELPETGLYGDFYVDVNYDLDSNVTPSGDKIGDRVVLPSDPNNQLDMGERMRNDAWSVVAIFAKMAYDAGFRDNLVMPAPLTEEEKSKLATKDQFGNDWKVGEKKLEANRWTVLNAYYELFTGKRSFDDYPEAAAYLDKIGVTWRGGEYVGTPTDRDVLISLLNYVSNVALDSATRVNATAMSVDSSGKSVVFYKARAFDYPAIADSVYRAVSREANALGECVAKSVQDNLDKGTVGMTEYHTKFLDNDTEDSKEAEAVVIDPPPIGLSYELNMNLEIPAIEDMGCEDPNPPAPTTSTTPSTPQIPFTTTAPSTPSTQKTTTPSIPSVSTQKTTTPEQPKPSTSTKTTPPDEPEKSTKTTPPTTPDRPQPPVATTFRESTPVYASGQSLQSYARRFDSAPQAPVAVGAAQPVYVVGPKVDTGGHVAEKSVMSKLISFACNLVS